MSFFKKQDSDDRLSLFLRLVVYLSASLAGLATVFIVGYILLKGIPFLRPELFSWTYNSENVSMLPALLNTILMAILALLIALPIGIGASVYLTEYAKSGNPLVTVVRLATETLSGIPSVIYGLFGALFFVKFLNLGLSIVAGAATLSIMILPLIMRTTEEALLSKQFVFSKFLGLSEEEIALNNKLLEKEKTDILTNLDNAKAEGTFTTEDDDFAF